MDKFFLKSKTILGVILTILPTLLPWFGISFGPDDTQLVNEAFDSTITAVGAVLAVYGRVKAKGAILAKP